MGSERVRCEDCEAWVPLGESGKGDCKRHPPVTFEQVEACWPRTMYDGFCYDGIPKKKEILSD